MTICCELRGEPQESSLTACEACGGAVGHLVPPRLRGSLCPGLPPASGLGQSLAFKHLTQSLPSCSRGIHPARCLRVHIYLVGWQKLDFSLIREIHTYFRKYRQAKEKIEIVWNRSARRWHSLTAVQRPPPLVSPSSCFSQMRESRTSRISTTSALWPWISPNSLDHKNLFQHSCVSEHVPYGLGETWLLV